MVGVLSPGLFLLLHSSVVSLVLKTYWLLAGSASTMNTVYQAPSKPLFIFDSVTTFPNLHQYQQTLTPTAKPLRCSQLPR
jgi:hypothetical protein